MTNSMNLELLIGKRIVCNPEGDCRSPYALSTPAALKNVYVTDADSSYTISDYLKIMSLSGPLTIASVDFHSGYYDMSKLANKTIETLFDMASNDPIYITNSVDTLVRIDGFEEDGKRIIEAELYSEPTLALNTKRLALPEDIDSKDNVVRIDYNDVRNVCHYICALANSRAKNKIAYLVVSDPLHTLENELAAEWSHFDQAFAYNHAYINDKFIISILPSKYQLIYYRGHIWTINNGKTEDSSITHHFDELLKLSQSRKIVI